MISFGHASTEATRHCKITLDKVPFGIVEQGGIYMSRKDNRGRVLHTGETQTPDGLYIYSYTDRRKRRKHVSSWKLIASDTIPKGKKNKPSLREMEIQIQYDLRDKINPRRMTIIDLVEEYIMVKDKSVRYSTKMGHQTVLNKLKRGSEQSKWDKVSYGDFGYTLIDDVTIPMVMDFFQDLQSKGLSCSSIRHIRAVLFPAFERAVQSNWIRTNPVNFRLDEIIVNDVIRREAISQDQQRKFLSFIKNDKHFRKYYDGINILFKTGLRISEFCGLTISDIDFKHKTLIVCRQLQRQSNMTYVIEKPKTVNGKRVIPLVDDVVDSFRRMINGRRKPAKEPVVDNLSGFLFLDKNDMPMVAYHWEKYFQNILAKYNKTFKEELPKITPHICRHTYCSNMAKAGMNPVYLSYLMGHSDKEITFNVYTTVNSSNSQEEICRAVKSITNNPYYQSVLN